MIDKNGYSPSIVQSVKECWVSKAKDCDLVRHEIFMGNPNRKLSKQYGLWVWLTPYWHNGSNYSVHGTNGHELDLKLKKAGQEAFEKIYSRDEFIRIFGKSYL